MKNRIWTDALREVRHTMGRFLSLLLLSALAVSFLAGLRTTAPDMERSADAYFDQQKLMDAHVLSTLGLTDDDVTALAGQPAVALAQGAYTVDAIASGVENTFIVKVLSLSSALNLPRLVAGRLPQGPGECLVEPNLLHSLGLALGDPLPLDTGTGTFEGALPQGVYTIVGTADSPLYISRERGSSSLGAGRVAGFVLLPQGAFSMEAYTDAYLLMEGAEALICYSDAYKDGMDARLDALAPLGEARASGRYNEVVGEANTKLRDAQSEFDKAEAEANQKLFDAKEELSDARHALGDGWADYREGEETFLREIADHQEKLNQAEVTDLPAALKELEQGELDYTLGVQKLEQAKKAYQEGLDKYSSGQGDYREGSAELTAQDAVYQASLQEIQSGETEYAAGYQKYTSGFDSLQDGDRQIQESEKTLAAALTRLSDGRQALAAGQNQYLAGKWEYDAGLAVYTDESAKFDVRIDAIKPLFPGFEDMGNPSFVAALSQAVTDRTAPRFYAENIQPYRAALMSIPDPTGNPFATAQQIAEYRKAQAILAALPKSGAELLAQVRAMAAGQAALDASAAKLDAAAKQLAASAQQLAASEGELAAGEREYAEGRAALSRAKSTLLSSTDAVKAAGVTLTDSRKKLDEGWTALQNGKGMLDDGWTTLKTAQMALATAEAELTDGAQELLDAEESLAAARRALDAGWAEYRQGLADLDTGKAALDEAQSKGRRVLSDSLHALEDGEEDYADGLRAYEEGKGEADEKLSDARQKLNDARRQIDDLEHCEWYLLGRSTNAGYVSFQSDAQRMGNLASVFPVIFFLVAALVCLTTMTRMVEEHRVQIGGLKALGYGKWTISIKYVGYGLAASLLGGGAGLAFGCTVIPWIIYTAWTALYNLGPLVVPFYPGISLLAVGVAVLTVAGSALLTCWSTLSEAPASLMRPKAPKSGKRVFLERIKPLWTRLSFTQKVTVRNLLRYKRRFIMTVVGIGGCTALIVTGFGLRDSIFSIMEKQYGELYGYTSQVGLVDNVTADELIEVYRVLDKNPAVTSYLPAHQTALTVESRQGSMDATLFAAGDPDAFSGFIRLRHRRDHRAVALPDSGVVLTEKLAALLKVKAGDEVVLVGDTRVTVRVQDVTEHYLGHFVYLSASAYQALYGQAPAENLLLARYAEDTREASDAVSSALIPLSGVTSVSRASDTRETYENSLQSVDYAVVVITASAAALAFVVLFNLTNINLTERMRELATLKVLGFHDPELAAYVFRENALLTVFGVAAGLVMGKFLHQWLVLTVEIDMLMFGRTAKPMSYLYAVVLTALFSVAVNLVAGRKLRKINMVESLKSVE